MVVEMRDILVVEDNPADAKLTMLALAACNLANPVVHVRDGEEALDYLFCTGKFASRKPETPVLVMLDLKMPKVDGTEVLEKIKSDERMKHIPVTVFTSSQEHPDVQKCYELGVNSYVVKPLDFDSFRKAVLDVGLYWGVVNLPT